MDYQLTRAAHAAVQSTLLGELLENAQIGALAADRGTYVAANEYACELLGYERSELIGTRVGQLHPFSDLPAQFAEIERGTRKGGDLTITRKDGEEIAIRYRAAETTLAGLPIVLGLFWRV
ncbi:MAG: PAS domain-containing protein [Gaiellaceae bacterium]